MDTEEQIQTETNLETPEIVSSLDSLITRLSEGAIISALQRVINTDNSTHYLLILNNGVEFHANLEELTVLDTRGYLTDELRSSIVEPLIHPNPSSLIVSEHTSRFSGAVWFNAIRHASITLAGVGGIGSYVAFLLSRLNPGHITIYDNDVVEEGNLSGQLYSTDNIGAYKTDSTARNMKMFSKFYSYQTIKQRFIAGSSIEGIAICGFDNMEARKVFYYSWKNHPSKKLFIDGRLAAEEFQVLAIQGYDEVAMQEYESRWLFDDSEVEAEVCSYKQTSYMANMIASVMVNILVNYIANTQELLMPYEVPFLTTYTGSTMYFNVRV